jgi:hypothetical protein
MCRICPTVAFSAASCARFSSITHCSASLSRLDPHQLLQPRILIRKRRRGLGRLAPHKLTRSGAELGHSDHQGCHCRTEETNAMPLCESPSECQRGDAGRTSATRHICRRCKTPNKLVAHLPWAHPRPFQRLYSFSSALIVLNNLGNLLLAQS